MNHVFSFVPKRFIRMTIEASSSNHPSPNSRITALENNDLTEEIIETEDFNDHEHIHSSQNQSEAGPSTSLCNGKTLTVSQNTRNSSNVNSIRKTLAKWLRLQKSSSSKKKNKNNTATAHNHGRSRYKLAGWPPRWVRRRSQSPDDQRHKQR